MKKYFFLIILLFIYNISFTQRVQLSGLPGQDKSMDITDMLNQIMAPYYDELTNLNNNRVNKEIEYKLWQDFKSNVNNFDQVNKYLMSYESAFRSLTNSVSDPSALQVQTTRIAKQGEYLITIQQLAQNHSISTASIDIDKTIPKGNFSLYIGKETNNINFNGGNIETLFTSLRNSLSNSVDIKLLNASQTSKILSLSSKTSGIENKMSFDGDLTPLLDIKLLTSSKEKYTNIVWNNSNTNQKLLLTNASKNIDVHYLVQNKTTLTFNAQLQNLPITPEKKENPSLSLTQLSSSEIGSITNQQIILPGASPILEEFEEIRQTQEEKIPIQQFTINFDDGNQTNITLSNDNFNVSLENFQQKTIKDFTIVSEGKILDLSTVTLRETQEGDVVPYNLISNPENAVILLDGVEIHRPSNIISNLISGVTVELLQDNKTNIKVKIEPNLELIKDSVIQWVVSYNNIMEDIFQFTTIPIDKIGRIKPLYKRQEDGDDLKEGTFYGNSSLISFKDRMRRMVGTPHGDNANVLSLLDQIGIYTRRRTGINTDPDALKKGTLTLDVTELEKKLTEDFYSVENLFIRDINGDNIADKGVIITATDTLKMMIGGNGYIDRIEQNNSRTMKDINSQITKKEDEISKTERKERQALLQMNQAITQSKALSESLQQRLRY